MRSQKWSHPLVNKLLERHHALTNQGKIIEYAWVPGHAGIKGNDLADAAAKDATHKPEVSFNLPSADYRREAKAFTNKKWQTKWDNTQANKLKNIQPKIKENKQRANCRRDQTNMSRLRIAVSYTHLTLPTICSV